MTKAKKSAAPKLENRRAKAKKPEPAKRPVGRPRKQVDVKALARLASVGASDDEIALVMGMSTSTLQNFRDDIKKGRANASMSVRRLQFKSANAGNVTMQIWLGKQLCGQSDKQQIAGPGGGPIKVDHGSDPAENEKRIAELLAKGGMA